MSENVIIEIIKIVPSLFLYLIIAILLIRLYRPFVKQLLPKLSNFKAFGIEIGFIKKELKAATHDYGMQFNDAKGQALLKRLEDYDVKRAVKILWIDDNVNRTPSERKILDNLGMTSDFAVSSAEAKQKIQQKYYDLVISDIYRGDNPSEGVEFLQQLENEGIKHPPFIFSIADLQKEKGTPPYAFGITNDPVELFHLIMDILAR